MVPMTPACKPLTEMFLDSVLCWGQGEGVAARGHHLGLLFQFPACAAPPASLTQLEMGSVCRVGSQVRLSVYTSPQPLPREDWSSLAGFHPGHLVLYLPATHLLFFHLSWWVLVIFLLNHCYLPGLVAFPSQRLILDLCKVLSGWEQISFRNCLDLH